MWKAAVIGTKPPFGRIANLAKMKEDLEIVAVCDLKEEWAKECAAKFGTAQAFTDYRKMLETDFDILFSFTGTYSRPDQVVAGAEAGKHIFTEKPLALSLEEGKRMVEAVRKTGVKYQIGYQLRTYYFARALQALVSSGTLGEVTSCMSRRFMPSEHWRDKDGNPTWYGVQEKSGGITVDYTTHDIDLLRWVVGDVRHVFAAIRRAKCQTGDDNVWSVLGFENGAMGMIGASFTATFGSSDIGVFGTKGSAMTVGYTDLKVKLWGGEEAPASKFVELPPDTENLGFEQYRNFFRAIREDREPSPSIVDGYKAIEVALAMQESAKSGERIVLRA
jgi:predicted dehydrogenase